MPLSSNREAFLECRQLWIEESVTKGIIGLCSGGHQGKSGKWFHQQRQQLVSLSSFMELSLLPPLWRFSKNRHSPWSSGGNMLSQVYCTIWNRTNPNTEAKQNMFLLPKISFLPKQTTTVLGNLLVRESVFESMRLTQQIQHILPGKILGHRETSVYPANSHLCYFYQMFWIWSSNTQWRLKGN